MWQLLTLETRKFFLPRRTVAVIFDRLPVNHFVSSFFLFKLILQHALPYTFILTIVR